MIRFLLITLIFIGCRDESLKDIKPLDGSPKSAEVIKKTNGTNTIRSEEDLINPIENEDLDSNSDEFISDTINPNQDTAPSLKNSDAGKVITSPIKATHQEKPKRKSVIKNVDSVVTKEEEKVDDLELLSKVPRTPEEIDELVVLYFKSIKKNIDRDLPTNLTLIENALRYSNDGVFHLFGAMEDFKSGNYSRCAIRAETAIRKGSKFISNCEKSGTLYKIKSLEHQYKKLPSNDLKKQFEDLKISFLMKFPNQKMNLPKTGKDFKHSGYLQ